MADQITFTPLRALDANGKPIASAEARFFLSGTTTPATVYADVAGTIPHEMPLVADARGIFAQVFSSQALKVEVKTPAGAMVPGFPIDPVPRVATNTSAASGITFTPTDAVPESDVQAAIERVNTNIEGSLEGVGLSATGSIGVISNLNATTTASGVYRVTSATTGTFPSGMAAADGGIFIFLRQTADAASATMIDPTDARILARDLASGVWSDWRESVTVAAKGSAGQGLIMNPAADGMTWGVPLMAAGYQSADLTCDAGDVHTLTHGLVTQPSIAQIWLKCLTAELGWAVGDWYGPVGAETFAGGGVAVAVNATQVKVSVGVLTIAILHATTGVAASITPANWALVVRAWK